MLFDTHAHYDDKRYDEDRDELLLNLKSHGIDKVVNIGANMKSSLNSIKLAEKYDFMYAAVGVHPHDADKMTDADLDTLASYCTNKKVVAIGEIGLDYYYEYSDRKIQQKQFIAQLELAKSLDMPVVVHSRDACNECYEIIKQYNISNLVVHCFSESPEMAMRYVDLGCYIGIGGVITFKSAKKLVEVVKQIPIDRILLETDCPYLTPEPHRGTRNSSIYMNEIASKVSEITQQSIELISEISYRNSMSFYRLK